MRDIVQAMDIPRHAQSGDQTAPDSKPGCKNTPTQAFAGRLRSFFGQDSKLFLPIFIAPGHKANKGNQHFSIKIFTSLLRKVFASFESKKRSVLTGAKPHKMKE